MWLHWTWDYCTGKPSTIFKFTPSNPIINPLNTKDVYIQVDALNPWSTKDVYIRPTKTFWCHHYWNQVVQISDLGLMYASRLALFSALAMQRENDMSATRAKFKELKVT